MKKKYLIIIALIIYYKKGLNAFINRHKFQSLARTHQISSNRLVNHRETSSRVFPVAYSTNTQLYVAIHCGLLHVICPDLLQIGISVEISFWDLRCLTHFRVLQHDHEIVVRGISLQKPSVHYSGTPQCEGEL